MTAQSEILLKKLTIPAEQLSREQYIDRKDPLHSALEFLVVTDVVTCIAKLMKKNYSPILLKTMKELDPSLTKRKHDLIKDELPLLLQAGEKLLGEEFLDQLNGELDTLWERYPVSRV